MDLLHQINHILSNLRHLKGLRQRQQEMEEVVNKCSKIKIEFQKTLKIYKR